MPLKMEETYLYKIAIKDNINKREKEE